MIKVKKAIPYFIVNVLSFYLLPLVIKDTGTAIFVLLVATPAICLISSLFYGVLNGFYWLYPTAIAILFVPTIFIFYNYTAWIYIIAYGVIAIVGNLIGMAFHKK